MITQQFKEAIKIIYAKLNNTNFPYAFIGSTNCALQGMEVSPRDLDLVMKLDDLQHIPKLFKEYSPSDIEELLPDSKDPAWTAKLANHPAFNVHAHVKEIKVQILGEKDNGDYVSKLVANRIIYIPFNGLKLPCFTLEAEAEAYEETYRPKKAERIRQFLQDSK
jgi:hypothetical protein